MPGRMAHGLARFQCSILNLRRAESPSTQNAGLFPHRSVCLSVRKRRFGAWPRARRPPRAAGPPAASPVLCWPRRGSFGLRLRLGVLFCRDTRNDLVLLQVAAAAMPLVVRAQMPGKGKRAFGFKSRHAEYYNTLVAGVLVAAYLLVAGFVVEPYVRERARGAESIGRLGPRHLHVLAGKLARRRAGTRGRLGLRRFHVSGDAHGISQAVV